MVVCENFRRSVVRTFVAGSLLYSVGCTNKSDSPARQPNKLAALEIQVLPGRTSPQQETLFQAMQSPGDVTQPLVAAFIETHRIAYEQTIQGPYSPSANIEQELKALSPSASDHVGVKLGLDALWSHRGVQLKYNADHASLFSSLNQNRMQCYSGTSLFEVVRQLKGNLQNSPRMSVVIFESGHVLPGYVEAGPQGNVLVGIETTVESKGVKNYGLVSGLTGVRVVDADYFMAIEALEPIISNPQHVVNKALELTATKIGLPLSQTEASIAGFQPLFALNGTTQLTVQDLQTLNQRLRTTINMSLLQFGRSDVASGDQTRALMDVVPSATRGSPSSPQMQFRQAPSQGSPPDFDNGQFNLELPQTELEWIAFLFQSNKCLPRAITKYYQDLEILRLYPGGYLFQKDIREGYIFRKGQFTFEQNIRSGDTNYSDTFLSAEFSTASGNYFRTLTIDVDVAGKATPIRLRIDLPSRDAFTLTRRKTFTKTHCQGTFSLWNSHVIPSRPQPTYH